LDHNRPRPTNYSLGEKATFNNTIVGDWIVSKAKNRPLEIIDKDGQEIRIWDWEPNKMVDEVRMPSKEFDDNDFYHLIVGGK